MLSVIGQLESQFSDDADIGVLASILRSKSMQALLKVHEQLCVTQRPPQDPVLQIQDVITLITQRYVEDSPEVDQLYSMISSSPHLSALLLCYDQIIRTDYGPSLPDLGTSDMVSCHDEETMKVVRLVKSSEPLGATITRDEATNNIIFSRIFKGGPADRSGLIHVNDILVEVNNVPTKGKSPEEIIANLANFQGPLIFRLIPGEPRSAEKPDDSEPMFVRAKFDFNPENDPQIPCIQAGIKFRKNDILRIVSRDDELWWQASFVDVGLHAGQSMTSTDGYQSNNQFPLKGVGLIPSSYLQNRREAIRMLQRPSSTIRSGTLERSFKEDSSSSLSRKKGPWTLLRRTFRTPKSRLGTSLSQLSQEFQVYDDSQYTATSFVAYDEMVLYHHNSEPNPRYRPLVLIGPQGVGRNLLKERLINSSPSRYGVPVPHTSRPQLPEEEDGKDYHFVSREFMEQGILDNHFIEFGEYKGNLYGTSIAAVKTVMEDQQICVLAPYSQALPMLHNKDVKPFVIFIQPSSSMVINSAGLDQSLLTDEMDELMRVSEKLQSEHGHMFDYTIIFKDADSALGELLEVAYMVANQPQWIPKAWTLREEV